MFKNRSQKSKYSNSFEIIIIEQNFIFIYFTFQDIYTHPQTQVHINRKGTKHKVLLLAWEKYGELINVISIYY